MNFTIGLSIGVTIMMLIAGRIIHRANTTLRTLHHQCGMAAEQIKYADCEGFQRLKSVMYYAEKRHGGLRLRFKEQYFMRTDD